MREAGDECKQSVNEIKNSRRMTKERIDKRRATGGGMHLRAAHAIAHLIALSYREPFVSRHQHSTANKMYAMVPLIRGMEDWREVCQTFFFSFATKGLQDKTLTNLCFLRNSKFFLIM